MSAFVCEARTVNRLATYIAYELPQQHRWLHDRIFEAASVKPWADDSQGELARALHLFNCDAVSQRYPQDKLEDLPGRIDEARGAEFPARLEPFERDGVGAHQLLKHLTCFLYQCAEGDCTERPLYEHLKDLQRFLAMQIIGETPEYKRAEWD